MLCQITGKRTTARTGADNDEVLLCGSLFWVKDGIAHRNKDTMRPTRTCALERLEQIDQIIALLFGQVLGEIMAAIED